ncbi:Tautomerase PptA [Agrobacterium sp. DSM 25558]|uniref:tautomerase family protein n=1 Tax=Agrobacterium sp. DSM 25558 TaxID=1907665 RepID=UPI00097248CB|nr:tautomerase family protein [Agrobacterium sp. DSM 25558]SCX28474.1 Tautomerase PptA [Agrobacterium sp. DSM 25558]
MPHVNIKHFPALVPDELRAELIGSIVNAVTRAFGCDEKVVSISIESISPAQWQDEVYQPEIVARHEFLVKTPQY